MGAGAAGLMLLWGAGCASFERDPSVESLSPAEIVHPDLRDAQELYSSGQFDRALIECVELRQRAPDTPGLDEMRQKCLSALLDQRAKRLLGAQQESRRQVEAETGEQFLLPDTYGLRRYVPVGEPDRIEMDGTMARILERPVSAHLQGANVSALISALSKEHQINLIADQSLATNVAINIEVDDVPLRELLDYVSRNYGVQFYLGRNVIWVTSADPNKAAPLQTRIYRLRHGLQYHGNDWGVAKAPPPGESDLKFVNDKATVLSTEKTYIETVLEKFVPSVTGSIIHLDRNTHTLLVRHTAENLKLISDVVGALDVDPPQVLIEARFVEIGVADLRELGLEWILNSPYVLTEKSYMQDGVWKTAPSVVLRQGNIVNYSPYTSDDSGEFPLGPQGAFGELRSGNPPTADQGLNTTFQGVLTEPMFQAVLHALEISGKGKTLSVPRVTTVNNNPAKLRDGDDLLYYTTFHAQVFSTYDFSGRAYQLTAIVPQGEPKTAELGITLLAVPSVGADRRTISLLLTPTVSELNQYLSYQDSPLTNTYEQIRQVVVKLPIITRREVQTKVIVQSGETVVMGGLIRNVNMDTVHRIPVLGSLPLLGALFRRTDTTEESRNLLIFVTAVVISERGEQLAVKEKSPAPESSLTGASQPPPPSPPAPEPAPAVPPAAPAAESPPAATPPPAPAPAPADPAPEPAAAPAPVPPSPEPAPGTPPAAPAPEPSTPAPVPAPAAPPAAPAG